MVTDVWDNFEGGPFWEVFISILNAVNHLIDRFYFSVSPKYMRSRLACYLVILSVSEIPKHAHLQFTTKDMLHVLSFVDYRRFGTWKINQDWGEDRGPDPVTQYQVRINSFQMLTIVLPIAAQLPYLFLGFEIKYSGFKTLDQRKLSYKIG